MTVTRFSQPHSFPAPVAPLAGMVSNLFSLLVNLRAGRNDGRECEVGEGKESRGEKCRGDRRRGEEGVVSDAEVTRIRKEEKMRRKGVLRFFVWRELKRYKRK